MRLLHVCKLCDEQIILGLLQVMQVSMTDISENVSPCSTHCTLIAESGRSMYLIQNKMLPCPYLEAHGLKGQAGAQSCVRPLLAGVLAAAGQLEVDRAHLAVGGDAPAPSIGHAAFVLPDGRHLALWRGATQTRTSSPPMWGCWTRRSGSGAHPNYRCGPSHCWQLSKLWAGLCLKTEMGPQNRPIGRDAQQSKAEKC